MVMLTIGTRMEGPEHHAQLALSRRDNLGLMRGGVDVAVPMPPASVPVQRRC